MSKVKGTTRAPQYQSAQTEDETTDQIKILGEKRRQIMRIEADMNDEISKIKQQYEAKAQPLKDEVSEIIDSVQAWAEANRSKLTDGGKIKTVKLATGEFNWRTLPPKVSLRGKPKIIDALKKLGLQRFLRVREDIDKEALLKEKQAATQIQGISITSAGETFAISPYELEIEGQQ